MRSKKDEELGVKGRFEQYVMPVPWSGCWEWMGVTQRYGHFKHPEEQLAHRASWRIYKGDIPDDLNVLHKCDNPSCVNPDHLFLGSHDDNMKDKVKKGRTSSLNGESHPMAKLTAEQVLFIRQDKRKAKYAAEEFGVSKTTVRDIKRGDIWQTLK